MPASGPQTPALHVVIRADAAPAIGTGHVMRCLTLADRLRALGAVVRFICRAHGGHLSDLIAARGFAVDLLPAPDATFAAPGHAGWLGATQAQDAADTLALLSGQRPDWLIVDHYGIDETWQRLLRPAVGHILVIDDLADRVHDCDVLLDQNLAPAGAARYDGLVPAHCARLCGPRYALLRAEFAAARAALAARDGSVRRLFVFLGGADQHNDTGSVLAALAGMDNIETDVVIGGANPHHAALARQCAALPGVRLHRQVDNVAALMAQADLAIGAGGGAMWERCSVGLPTIALALAENQRPGCTALADIGGTLYLGESGPDNGARLAAALQVARTSPGLLRHMSATGLALVDGQGADRVARRLVAQGLADSLTLRRATMADCDDIHAWRNAEAIRRVSGDTRPVALEAHREWFAKVLTDTERVLLLGEIDGRAAGVLRYDRSGAQATVSVYLTPAYLGKGIGPALLAQGSAWVARHWPGVDTIEAVIRPDNLASSAAFASAGYRHEFDIYRQRIQA
ncbi:UDP-2,4-diacetamido-2,4,6-trideoxy-beta-L-altropyranose hydrolase [[Empedobacter] haloabium]|uniref:UDP-2,4-diacetamido-2,4, 6-trideoxy-beta-L-altropyranose hydrolase n=1 Tax=[Empedobacter] haloabium TaxID=592317 RepID=A0ABZ1UJZ8_9BURK